MVVSSVAYPGKIVGIKVSLIAVELIIATSTVSPVGNRVLGSVEGISAGDSDGVPAEDPRLNERFDDSVDGCGTFGTSDGRTKGRRRNFRRTASGCPQVRKAV